ncbi:MAG: hypothetical protein JWP92_14 [Caulobacter sp.]|nr:hypothetical protein [Caulobacter sp.]
MTQPPAATWSEQLQLKLMAALDAAWAILETSDDPAALRKARDRAKACGDIAAVARKIAAMSGPGPRKPAALLDPAAFAAPATQADHARRALETLRANRGGRS